MTQKNQVNLGKELGKIRSLHGDSLEQLAGRLGVTRSYLSKIENGHKPVTETLLQKYSQAYSKSPKFMELMGGHKLVQNIKDNKEESNNMSTGVQKQPPVQELQVNLNPEKTPVLYSDWQKVDTNDGGVVLSFAQSASPLPVQQIVARIGMSHPQAKQVYTALGEVLKEYYSSKNQEF